MKNHGNSQSPASLIPFPHPENEVDDGEWRILVLIPETLAGWAEDASKMAELFIDRFTRYPELLVVHPTTWKKMQWVYANGLTGDGERSVWLCGYEASFKDALCRVLLEPGLPENEIHLANAPNDWWADFAEDDWLDQCRALEAASAPGPPVS